MCAVGYAFQALAYVVDAVQGGVEAFVWGVLQFRGCIWVL